MYRHLLPPNFHAIKLEKLSSVKCSLQSVDDDDGTKSNRVVATKEVHFRAIDGSFGHK